MTTERQFSPGFRLSVTDVTVLIVGTVLALLIATLDLWYGLAVAFVVAHFFLFCNVLRMSRSFELIWAAVFVALATVASLFEAISWLVAFAVSAFVTLVLAILQARKPSYHGAAWQLLNPKLLEWWNSQANGVDR